MWLSRGVRPGVNPQCQLPTMESPLVPYHLLRTVVAVAGVHVLR